jgi:SPP1 family predicted phage head-tail adaptor
MELGYSKERVSFEQIVQTRDAEGTVIDTPKFMYKRWATVRPARGREAYVNDQFLPDIEYVVSVRYDSQTKLLTSHDQIRWKGKRLQITSQPINVEERNEEIRMFCTRYGN